MKKYRPVFIETLLGASVFICIVAFALRPSEVAEAARGGIALCLDIIMPSLFPFFVLSTLIVELGLARYLGKALEGVMRPLFSIGGACSAAVVLGFVGGYPVGDISLVQQLPMIPRRLISVTDTTATSAPNRSPAILASVSNSRAVLSPFIS